jgi:carbon-monoxide dehydrogenase small subunit
VILFRIFEMLNKNSVIIQFKINGEKKQLEIPAGMTALELIRDGLELKSAKEGCGIGECGACTIIVNGQAVNSCLMFAARLDGCEVLTVEGLDQGGDLHPIQEAFAEKHAVQCGFCTPGLLMSTRALLSEHQRPSRAEIIKAISGNLCRCTGYHSIIEAVETAAGRQGDTRKK